MMQVALVGQKAEAQDSIKVIVADIVNVSKNPNASPTLGVNATAAVYNELSGSGQGRFDVSSSKDVSDAAKEIGIRTPSGPGRQANYSDAELLRLAKRLQATAVVTGTVSATPPLRGRGVTVALSLKVRDLASSENINGGIANIVANPRPGQGSDPEELLNKALEDATQLAVREIVSHQLVTSTILNVTGSIAIINRGIRDGLKVGDEMTVFRNIGNSEVVKVGKLKLARVYAGDSEADIRENTLGIAIEDQARVIYFPRGIIGSDSRIRTSSARSALSFSAIGATLAAIGIGVVLASAARGGQSSVSDVSAEATSNALSAQVRIRWGDNVFGNAGVTQYKIFRSPDFAFSPSFVSGTGGAGGGGGNGNTTVGTTGFPIGVSDVNRRQFDDTPSPSFRTFTFATGISAALSGSNSNGGQGGGTTTTGGCASTSLASTTTLDFGFRPGVSYQYQVNAVVLRPRNLSGGSTNTGGGGNGGGGGGGGNGGGGGGGGNGGGGGGGGGGNTGSTTDCIETDPITSGLATPITPIILNEPKDQVVNVDIRKFAPSFSSRVGADVFQIQVSTDRTFRNASRILKISLASTSPNADGVPQALPQSIDLASSSELLSDPVFQNYVNSSQSTGTSGPPIYWRVGARHDDDSPGPVHNLSLSASDTDRTYRYVYNVANQFSSPPTPPNVPGKNVSASRLNKEINSGRSPLPFPGAQTTRSAINRVLTPQEILTGRGRIRH